MKALPLYPQDAYSTTSSAFAEAASAAEEFGLGLEFNRSYFDNPEYISLIADSFRSQKAFRPDAAIVSFHSVPISHLKKTQYLQQCGRHSNL
ncbi:MAG: ferrochelatase [Bacilli bacterium]